MDKKYYDIKIIPSIPYIVPLFVRRMVENLLIRVFNGYLIIEYDETKIIDVVNNRCVTFHHKVEVPTLEGYEVVID